MDGAAFRAYGRCCISFETSACKPLLCLSREQKPSCPQITADRGPAPAPAMSYPYGGPFGVFPPRGPPGYGGARRRGAAPRQRTRAPTAQQTPQTWCQADGRRLCTLQRARVRPQQLQAAAAAARVARALRAAARRPIAQAHALSPTSWPLCRNHRHAAHDGHDGRPADADDARCAA